MKEVSPEEARQLITREKENPNFVILDVRTPGEFELDHLEHAINIDFYMNTFEEELNKLDKDKVYLVHCRSGGRSEKACEIMNELGFKKITNVVGFLFPHLG
ncbi:rhodanese-like domain-containing protein [Candidatus Woesearchaeota archaeon]|nr:rhodanese-like domain-containing protein [Candidatus Woesearchaeota archaeon]